MKLVHYEEKLRKPTQDEIDAFVEYRANHVALVQKLGEVAFGLDLSGHDMDKIVAVGKELDAFAIRNAYHDGKLTPSKEDLNEIRKVSARHCKSQKHHPEYWDDSITIRNCKEDESIVHATRMPKRYILEMACDWSACALNHNESLFKWYNKVIDETLFLTDNQKVELISALFQIKKVVEKYGIQFPNVDYTAESHFQEAGKLDKIGLFANSHGYDVRGFIDWVQDKIENEWGQVIKKDKSNESEANVNISPVEIDADAVKNDIGKLADELRDDQDVEEWRQDSEDNRKFSVTLNNEDEGWNFELNLDIRPNPKTGRCEEWVPTQEGIWAWFLCKKINGQDFPKTIEEVRDVDWKKELKIDVPFEIPEAWMESFLEGSDALLPYLDSSKKYIGFRETTVANTVNLMDYPFLHDFINAIPRKRTDLGLPQDRNIWNPSDIYMIDVSKAMGLKRVFQDMATPNSKNFPTIDSINAWFAQGLKDKTVVGISLKTYGIGNTSYANLEDSNKKVTYTKVNGKVPFIAPKLTFDHLGSMPDTMLFIGSLEEKRRVDFHFNTSRVFSVVDGANSKEGMCYQGIMRDMFKEFGIEPPKKLYSHENLYGLVDAINVQIFTFYFGDEECKSRLEFKQKLKGYFSDLDYEYGKAKGQKYYDNINYWAYVLTVLLLMQKGLENKRFGYVMNTMRNGCKKLGKMNAPFVYIN